jgi:UDP-N-acetylmuramoyl-tripeptide--D-alanyl-D-alanine ligase
VILVGGDFEKITHPFVQLASAAEAGQWLKAQNLEYASLLLKGSRSIGMEDVLSYINN